LESQIGQSEDDVAGNANFKTSGISYASREKQMAAYDQLPRSMRDALANAAFDWAAYPIRQRFERDQRTAKEYVVMIKKWDRDQIAKDRARVWGIESGSRRQRRVAH
jgi:hypothetical protein